MLNIVISAIIHLVGLLVTFFTLCILCDEHLVPAVEVFIEQFQVPEEVAGMTLYAILSSNGSHNQRFYYISLSSRSGDSRRLWLSIPRAVPQLSECHSTHFRSLSLRDPRLWHDRLRSHPRIVYAHSRAL